MLQGHKKEDCKQWNKLKHWIERTEVMQYFIVWSWSVRSFYIIGTFLASNLTETQEMKKKKICMISYLWVYQNYILDIT